MTEENSNGDELKEEAVSVEEEHAEEIEDEPVEELEEEPTEELEEEPPEEEPELAAYLREEEPAGKTDKAKYWLLRGLSDDEIAESKDLNPNTVRMARGELVKEGLLKKERKPAGGKQKTPSTALTSQAPSRNLQVFAKGSPPEAIIESISLPIELDGQAEGFEKGMKFGMSQLVLAVRIMQELSAIGLQQVRPLIDMTRSVREGEAAAFKGGADEGALRAAQAMGATIMPMMSEMQTAIANAGKGSEADPVKAMMVRTMEPMMKNLLGRVVPGMRDEPPSGWSRRTE